MKIFFYLCSFTWKAMLKNWKSFSLLLLAPVLFLIGAGVILTETMEDEARIQKFPVAIVDEDDTLQTEYVIKQLTESEQLSSLINPVYPTKTEAQQMLSKDEIAAFVVLPDGFSHSIATGENMPLVVVGNKNKPLQAQLFRYVMDSAADYTSAAQSGINTIDHFLQEEGASTAERQSEFRRSLLSFGLHVLDRGSVFEERIATSLFQQDMKQYYILSFFLLLLMIWSYSSMLFVKGLHSNSVLKRMQTHGVSSLHVHLAQFSCMFLLVFVLSLGLYAVGIEKLDLSLSYTWGQLIGSVAASSFAFLATFALLQAIFVSEKLYQLVGVLFLAAASLVGGHILPSVYLPEWLLMLQTWSVNAWSLQMMFGLFGVYESVDWSESMSWLVVYGLTAFSLSLLWTALFQKRRVSL
ncbi:ABC transporter permease [Priestia flexa]|uniref:ABC transporter permease n=1 Tax=Priestia flexa TaxID=86664 RepID=UPI001F4C7128|nr:ABC transporter permease [Priestia flexa]